MSSLAIVLVYGVPEVPRVELALPAAPAVEVAEPPPVPPAASCVRYRSPVVVPETALLSVEGVTRSFYGVHALNGVDLQIRAGRITGLIGPNGAGKTTLFNCISGMVPPGAGRILFDGEDITGWRSDRITRRGRELLQARGLEANERDVGALRVEAAGGLGADAAGGARDEDGAAVDVKRCGVFAAHTVSASLRGISS